MATWLKRGKDIEKRAEANRQVRVTVETILSDIEKPDNAACANYHSILIAISATISASPREIDGCAVLLTDQDPRNVSLHGGCRRGRQVNESLPSQKNMSDKLRRVLTEVVLENWTGC